MLTKIQEEHEKTVLDGAYYEYQKKLNSYSFFKIHDRATAEDLVQDTFMKTWSYLVKGGKVDVMKAFLYHILNQLIVDHYRKRKTVSLDAMLEKGYEPAAEGPLRVFNIYDGKAALLLIKLLPDRYRTVMAMRFVQELSLKEISLITGRSRNTVAVQVHRGLGKLRLLYKHP